MKKTAILLFLFFTSYIFGFKEGEDYIKLATPLPNANKTLMKVFSYNCSSCYKYEKELTPSLVMQTKDILSFKYVHLKYKGDYAEEASELFAVLTFKDIQNNISNPTSSQSLFRKAQMAYHKIYDTKIGIKEDSTKDFLSIGLNAAKISEDEFNELKKNPQVQNILKSWNISYEVLKLKDKPVYIVNGKYLIKTQTIKSMGSFVALIKELAKK
jgi:thiol:disulfide interchange protein DsbA